MTGLQLKKRQIGSFEKVAGHETVSEIMNDIEGATNMQNSDKEQTLNYNRISGIVDAEGDHRIEVKKYDFSDGSKMELQIDRERNSIQTLKKYDKDGNEIAVDMEKVQNPEQAIKDVEAEAKKKAEEEEGRTPWGDAEDRRNR